MRFEGTHFTSWNPPQGERLLDSRIISLVGARDGSLWIGTGYSLSHWKDGRLVNLTKLSGRIEAMLQASDGSIWLVRTQATDGMGPLCRIEDEKPRCFGQEGGIPFESGIHLAPGNAGELWVGGYSELCLWKPGSCRSYFAKEALRPETFASLRAIGAGRVGTAWAAIDSPGPVLQLQHFAGGKLTPMLFPHVPVNSSDVTSLFVDRDDVLWIGTAHHGIFRIRNGEADHFGKEDGLSSDAVGRFYQDAEGTIWVTTSEGIDNFRDLQTASYSMAEGLSAAAPNAVLATHDGSIWLVNFHALDRLHNGKFSSIQAGKGLPGQNVTTFLEDHSGDIWVGVDDGLWIYSNRKFRPVRRRDGRALGVVYSIVEDNVHNIWVRAGHNLYRIEGSTVRDELTSQQISTSYILAANPRGGIFLGLVNGDLVELRNGQAKTIPSGEVGNTSQIRDLLVEPDGSVWGTTLDEVARWKNGIRRNLTTRNGLPCDGIFALVKDAKDSLWVDTRCGLIEIENAELENWWGHSDSSVKFRLFDILDGIQPGLTSLKPQTARSPDGRLWFVNGHLLQVIDPDHLRKNDIPPPVDIERIVADRKENSLLQKQLRLPALTRELEIDYTALSFVSPQKVRFRYKLEGQDPVWVEAGTRRQAFYNNLRPGSYTFRVIACNNDGLWNEQGTLLSFSVAPAWYQTASFRILAVILCLLGVWSAHRIRIRQVAKAMSARFDARLAERTRIAREFHDTFLQTVQGSKLLAEDALEDPGDSTRMRRAMEQLSNWLGQATQEGRAALNSLRSSATETNDLAEALRRATENGLTSKTVAVNFSVVGRARDMHPIVRDEIYRIGYEAIRNAYAHSRASKMEIEIRYARDLSVRVKDNGIGIDRDILDAGKAGHFGLQGMRERASRIGGKLTLVSTPGSGTELILSVPGGIVYRNAAAEPSSRLKELLEGISRRHPE